MKRGQGTSPTNLSGRKSKRRSSRGSRLAAAAEGISSEILSPSLQTKNSETSTADPTNEHPGREAPPGRIPAGIDNEVSHALQVRRETSRKESRQPVPSPQSTRGSVSSVPSTVARRARPSTTKTPTRRSTPRRPQEKESIGKDDGQSDVVGHEGTNLLTLLYPAVEPQEELDLASGLEQQVDGERMDQEVMLSEQCSGDINPQKCPLEIMFHGLEQVLLLFRQRKQTPLLKKITAGVEAMCGRSFTKHHLAQIIFVQPDAYKVSSKTDAKPTRGGYRLRDILIEFSVSGGAGEVTPKSGGNGSSNLRSPGGSATESVSSRRRKVFQQLLLVARSRYCKCTAGVEKSMKSGECSCIPEAPLPDTSPLPVDGKSSPARSNVLSKVRGLLGSGGVPRGGGESDEWDAPKNVDALRERLRQKDLISALKRNKTGEEKEADRRRKGNLPALADAVRNTCGLTALVEALSSSSRHALSTKEAKERLRMLADVVPEWCSIIAPPNARKGASSRNGIVDEGMVGRPIKAQEVVRVNTRIHYGEVRQMIVFMVGRSNST